jgi:hypothetical protein
MIGKTKRILIRRRIREVITVTQPKTFVCEHCGKEQNFKLVENANAKQLTNGENNDENNKQTN